MSDEEFRVDSLDDLPGQVACGAVSYKGIPHFGMSWLTRNGKKVSIKATLLDPEDAQIVYRDLGRWLRGEFPKGADDDAR